MPKLIGKNAIITGASRGLGKEIANKMWQQGANLLLVGRNADSLETVIKNLENHPEQRAYFVPADLAHENSLNIIMTTARSCFQRLDILVNNAAIQGPIGPSWTNDQALWEQSIYVNLISPIKLSRYCAEWMLPQRQGKIISLSGGGATASRPNFSSYAVAKTGIVRFSEILADELKEHNIQVNCVAPGVMATSLLDEIAASGPSLASQKEFDIAIKIKRERGSSLEHAAQLVVFLACTISDGITGKLISAVWDPWEDFPEHLDDLQKTDIYTLRRIIPKDRGMDWGDV